MYTFTYNQLIAEEGAASDIVVIAIDETYLAKGKLKAEKLYRDACRDQSIRITDWEDHTDCMHINHPDLVALDDCDLLSDLKNLGYTIIID